MMKSLIVKLVFSFLLIMSMSGCLFIPLKTNIAERKDSMNIEMSIEKITVSMMRNVAERLSPNCKG